MLEKIFNCDNGTLFCTALLAIFGFCQWQAVAKQNDQNLFKLRLECMSKTISLISGTQKLMGNVSTSISDNENLYPYLKDLNLQHWKLINLLPEIQLLFNSKVFLPYLKTIVFYNVAIGEILKIIEQDDISDEDKKNKILEIIDKMFSMLREEELIALLKYQTKLDNNYFICVINKFRFWMKEKIRLKKSS